MVLEPDTIDETRIAAEALRARAGLSAVASVIVAVFDAIERGWWPGEGVLDAIAGAFDIERDRILAELVALVDLGLVQRDRLALASVCRAALRGEPGDLGPAVAYLEGRGTPGDLAPPGAAIVFAGGDARARLAVIRDAAPGEIVLYDLERARDVTSLAEAARDAWLRGGVLGVEVGVGAVDRIDAIAAIPARLAISIDAALAGEALARLREVRAVTLSMLRPVEQIRPRAAVVPALQPLVSTTWKGMHVDAPAHRVVALAGDAIAAARALAAGHGVELVRVDVAAEGGVACARDAFATHRVVWLDGTASLDPIAAGAIAALVAQAAGLVLVDAAAVPAELRASIEATIEA